MKYVRAAGLLGAVFAISCADGPRTPSSPAPQRNMTGLSISETSVTIGRRATARLQSTATYSDASAEDVTTSATWTTANADVASVSAGVITGTAPGRTQIQVAFSGKAASSEVIVRRNIAMASSVTVAATNANATNANVAQLRAYVDGTLVADLPGVSDHYSFRARTIAFSGVNVTPGEHTIAVDVRKLGFASFDARAAGPAATYVAAPGPVIQLTDADTGESLNRIELPIHEVADQTEGATITWQLSVPILDQ